MKVRLNADVYIDDDDGNSKLYRAREAGRGKRPGPQLVHDIAAEKARDLIARGDAAEVKSDAAPRVRRAVSAPATRALADAKDRTEPHPAPQGE